MAAASCRAKQDMVVQKLPLAQRTGTPRIMLRLPLPDACLISGRTTSSSHCSLDSNFVPHHSTQPSAAMTEVRCVFSTSSLSKQQQHMDLRAASLQGSRCIHKEHRVRAVHSCALLPAPCITRQCTSMQRRCQMATSVLGWWQRLVWIAADVYCGLSQMVDSCSGAAQYSSMQDPAERAACE
jgi:hypothetical protein